MQKLFIFSLLFVASLAQAQDACEIEPCFIDTGTVPPIGRQCREDRRDRVYENRLMQPAPFCPSGVCPSGNCAPNPLRPQTLSNLAIAIANRALHKPIKPICFARAMQYSPAIASTATFCASDRGRVDDGNHHLSCPSPAYVDTITSWVNRTMECVRSSENGKKYDIPSWLMLAIITHESRGQVSAASWAGKGLMQLTTSAVKNFYQSNRNLHRELWEDAKDNQACLEFREPMSREPAFQGRRINPEWECMMSSPEGIPRHLIVATTNLQYCRKLVDEIYTSKFSRSDRLLSVKNAAPSMRAKIQATEKEEMIADMIMACHNWGRGNLAQAAIGISGRTFRDSKEFRETLISPRGGWRFTGKDGVRDFPQITRDDLKRIENGFNEGDIRQSPVEGGCTE